ncbi:MAG: hypothetical protein FWE40_05425 [Oscillospiraceae bacterium]|nr:hypothetical protein [Oscillospiraceae bacterium]
MTEAQRLAKIFTEARNRLYDTIVNYQGVGTKTYANEILQSLNREIARLQAVSDLFTNNEIPRQYQRGLDETYRHFQRNNLRMQSPQHFAVLHADAIYDISREMQFNIDSGLITIGRQVQRYVDIAQADALRQMGLEQAAINRATGGTVRDMRNAMIRELQTGGFMTVQYGEGPRAKQVPIDVYAAMVARTTTREAGNSARANQMTANGYDLLMMSEHFPTCPKCAPLQGRVYSITGGDHRFPNINEAWADGYKTVHPNCIHVFTPWIEELATDKEKADALAKSNAPFEDTRGAAERKLYDEQQAKNRALRQEVHQYERYKARLGENAPKTLAAFRRIKRADGEAWGRLQRHYTAIGHYNKAVAREPTITQAVQNVADTSGLQLAGLEHRIKSPESYLRKVDAEFARGNNSYEVRDILRYTGTAPPADLTDNTLQSIDNLRDMGYNTSSIKNSWDNAKNPYKGVNTTVRAPNGQAFEVQYHTPESFAIKQAQHAFFEEARSLSPTSSRVVELNEAMHTLSEPLTRPTRIDEVS